MDENELAFRMTFRQTRSSAKHLVKNSISNANVGLRKLMAFALHSHTPSGYPFVLKYSFGESHLSHDVHNAPIGAECLEFRGAANISDCNVALFQSSLQVH